MDIIVPQSDETGQHTREDIARLQRLLAESIVARSWLMDRMTALEAETPDRHWFVADPAGYCQACNLPEKNARHVPRVA